MSKYLLEIGCEELPYKFIPSAIEQLQNGFENFLNSNKNIITIKSKTIAGIIEKAILREFKYVNINVNNNIMKHNIPEIV